MGVGGSGAGIVGQPGTRASAGRRAPVASLYTRGTGRFPGFPLPPGGAGPRLLGSFSGVARPAAANMKIKTRNSKTKRARKGGFRARQKTKGGRKTNKRQRARHGSI